MRNRRIIVEMKKRVVMKKHFDVSRLIAFLTLLVLSTFLVYAPALQNGFVNLDDDVMLVNNPAVRSLSGEHIRDIVIRPHAGLYHPLVTLSYALEYHVFGMTPAVYHATNIALHVINTLLAFCLVMLIFKDQFAAFVAAAFFAFHPVHVESVAWISERKDVLYSLFYLAAAVGYIYYRQYKNVVWYAASVVLFILSLLAKPMALSLPVVLLLIDLLQERRSFKTLIGDKIPYVLLAFVAGVVAVRNHYTDPNIVSAPAFSFLHNALNAAFNLLFYMGMTIYPDRLAAFYPYSTKFPPGIASVHIVAAAMIVILGFFAAGLYRRSRRSAFGLLFFLATVFPVLQFIPVGQEIPADRYLYLPSLGLFMAAGLAASWLYRGGTRGSRVACVLLLAVLFVMLAQATRQQARVWHDSVTLWSAAIDRYPKAFAAYRFRADAYREQKNYAAAFADIDAALRVRPGYAEAYNTRGNLHADLQNYPQAIEDYSAAIAAAASYPAAYYNRAAAFALDGNEDRAEQDYLQALALNPRDALAYNNLGVLYARKGNYNAALRCFSAALSYDRDLLPAAQNRKRIEALLTSLPVAVPEHR